MTKIKIILVFLLLTAAGVVFQNCGRHNPDSINGTRIDTLGGPFVGKTYILYRIVRNDGSEELYNQEKATAVTDVYIKFDSNTSVSGRDGCNHFWGKLIWSPKASINDLPEIEFFNMSITEMACDPAPAASFAPEGSYYYDAEKDLFRLIKKDSTEMFEFSELASLPEDGK